METGADTPSSEQSVPAEKKLELTTEKLKFRVCQEVEQYGEKLLKRLDEFRKKNMFYDVTLKTTDGELTAHKVVLAACGGMFRSHFVDVKTKKIKNVNEVAIDCPTTGLRTILKFAYSGVLEIQQSNLLPTFLAAVTTDMKEMQDISADISMLRLGWMLTFDGTEKTLSAVSLDGKTNEKGEEQPTLDHAFILLHRLLELNAPSFAPNGQSNGETKQLTSNGNSSHKAYPCLEEVEGRWPKLKSVYTSMVDCLHKAQAYNKSKLTSNVKPSVKSIDNTQSESKDQRDENSKIAKGKEETVVTANVKVNAENISDDKKLPKEDRKEETSKITEATNGATVESTSKNDAVNHDLKAPQPVARKSTSTENVKPVSKPRTVSLQTKSQAITRSHSTGSRGEVKKNRPPSPPKESTRNPPQNSSANKISKTKSVSEASPVAPRKKHAAPKPPGPPLGSTTKAPAPKPVQDTPPKASAPNAGKSTPKVPPPRPKPPSVKKKDQIAEVSGTNYDEKMNPFADEDQNENEKLPNKTKATVQKKDSASSQKDEIEDYDNSLNPFEE